MIAVLFAAGALQTNVCPPGPACDISDPGVPASSVHFFPPPMPPLAMDMAGAITLAYPPCGTPEARAATVCLRWTVRHCMVTASTAPPAGVMVDAAVPIGCDWRASAQAQTIPGGTNTIRRIEGSSPDPERLTWVLTIGSGQSLSPMSAYDGEKACMKAEAGFRRRYGHHFRCLGVLDGITAGATR